MSDKNTEIEGFHIAAPIPLEGVGFVLKAIYEYGGQKAIAALDIGAVFGASVAPKKKSNGDEAPAALPSQTPMAALPPPDAAQGAAAIALAVLKERGGDVRLADIRQRLNTVGNFGHSTAFNAVSRLVKTGEAIKTRDGVYRAAALKPNRSRRYGVTAGGSSQLLLEIACGKDSPISALDIADATDKAGLTERAVKSTIVRLLKFKLFERVRRGLYKPTAAGRAKLREFQGAQ